MATTYRLGQAGAALALVLQTTIPDIIAADAPRAAITFFNRIPLQFTLARGCASNPDY
ncbi:hypothetical protein [Nocardia alba]|uniref:hypothetical protein n=1 Tax=Nocardia alba TaxID=225051 RepID=UPI001FB43A97|nr:hypothetical protein [Nocardia alba]